MVTMRAPEGYEPAGSQWVVFAAVLMLLAGVFNVIDGIAAISGADYLADRLLFANLDAWGWFFLVWGVIQILSGISIYRGASWAARVGIGAAFLNALAQ